MIVKDAEEALEGIRREGQARATARREHAEATARLQRYIEAARRKGVSVSQIAREAGLSRQGVYDLLASP